MILTFITGSFTLAALMIVLAIVQFGVFLVVGVLAVGFASMIGLVIFLITVGREIFTERKPQGRF